MLDYRGVLISKVPIFFFHKKTHKSFSKTILEY